MLNFCLKSDRTKYKDMDFFYIKFVPLRPLAIDCLQLTILKFERVQPTSCIDIAERKSHAWHTHLGV